LETPRPRPEEPTRIECLRAKPVARWTLYLISITIIRKCHGVFFISLGESAKKSVLS